jgi:hypothetical protein
MRYFIGGLFSAVLVAASIGVAQSDLNRKWLRNTVEHYVSGGGQVQGHLYFGDDEAAYFGDDSDYWWVYDGTNTQLELNAADCDGASGACIPITIDDGTDDVLFTGNLSINGGVILDSGDQLDLGGACTDGYTQGTGAVCVGGSFQVDGEGYFDARAGFYHSSKHVDNIELYFGSSLDTTIMHSTTQTPDSLTASPGAESNAIIIHQAGDAATDFALAQQTNPTLALQASDQTKIGYRVALDYDTLWCDNPVTDIAPHDFSILGANSWSQATGASQTGAALNIAGGIGTNQIVCADRTVGDQDVLTLTVDGTASTLTESTDFDCEGEASEEVCCDNLGTAITTAALGITPDCDTTAGTCYLAFDDDIISFDMSIADGAANGVFATLTEGADGSVLFSSGSVTYPAIGWLEDNDGSGTGLYRSGADSIGFASNGSSKLIIGAQIKPSVRIYNTSDQLELGTACTDGHSQGTGDVCVGGSFQADGTAWFDSTITGAGTNNSITQGLDNSGASGYALQLNSTAGSEMTASSGTQYWLRLLPEIEQSGTAAFKGIFMDVTDSASGSGQDYLMDLQWDSVSHLAVQDDGETSISGGSLKGAATWVRTKTESVTFAADPGDASKATTGTLIPDGAWLIGVTTRVTTGNTGGCTSMDIGDGADVDLWGNDQGISQNDTTTNADATANWSNPELTGQEVTITAVGGDGACDDMVVAITAHYFEPSAATSN